MHYVDASFFFFVFHVRLDLVTVVCDMHFEFQKTHIALAFEMPGGWLNKKEAMTLSVLQVLFSSKLCSENCIFTAD